jgi:hypothetical protein
MDRPFVAELIEALRRKNYFFSNAENHLNLVGIRNSNQRAGKYDDFLCGLVMKEDAWRLYVWPFTTDPSTSYLRRPINRKGAAILCPGQYLKVYRLDNHNNWCYTLCQRGGPVKVFRDNDKDSTLDWDSSPVDSGYFGINFHWDRNEPSGKSGVNYRSSAGCQVFRYKSDWKEFRELVNEHVEDHGKWFDYTLLEEGDMINVPPPEHPHPTPNIEHVETTTAEEQKWAEWVVKKEGRFKKGKLTVYKLPSGDGGGSYEVAGINEKYHPKQARQLAKLIESGNPELAQDFAEEYILEYTKTVKDWHPSPSVRFVLRDCAFNRGKTGAARIYQIAVNAKEDGKVGDATKKKALKYDDEELVYRLLAARQTYEMRKRNPSSKFWKGLVNRWIACTATALST